MEEGNEIDFQQLNDNEIKQKVFSKTSSDFNLKKFRSSNSLKESLPNSKFKRLSSKVIKNSHLYNKTLINHLFIKIIRLLCQDSNNLWQV